MSASSPKLDGGLFEISHRRFQPPPIKPAGKCPSYLTYHRMPDPSARANLSEGSGFDMVDRYVTGARSGMLRERWRPPYRAFVVRARFHHAKIDTGEFLTYKSNLLSDCSHECKNGLSRLQYRP